MDAVLVLHGPNLNLLGNREPEFYGRLTLDQIDRTLVDLGGELGVEVCTFQSNHEGALIDKIHEARSWAAGIIINPGGYTTSSVAMRDAITAIGLPAIEVHLSNIHAREEFRRLSLIAPACMGSVTGLGWRSYTTALRALAEILSEEKS